MSIFAFATGLGRCESWSGSLVPQEPLVHGAEGREGAEGNSVGFRRLCFICDGRRYEVPVVSGNAIRGVWRRLLAGDLLARVGLQAGELGQRVRYLLTSGGGLEARDAPRRGRQGRAGAGVSAPPAPESPLRIGSREELRSTLTLIALMGAACGNSMLEGSLRVGYAIPVCAVTAGALGQESRLALADVTGWTFQTRRDDRLQEGPAPPDRPKQQQIVRYEYIAPGVTLHHTLGVEAAGDLELSCLAHALELFRSRPFLGGRWASGSGRVAVAYPAVGDPALYRAWVAEHRECVREYLLALEPPPGRRAG